MKKSLIIGALLLIIGIVAGWLCREYHFRGEVKMMQNDTIVQFDTIKYSQLELIGKNYRLDIPKISRPELVFIPADSTSIIYKDRIRYVTVQRQFFYTRTPEVEIFHSGIDSRIDSLNVYAKSTIISNRIMSKEKKHSLGVGIEASYSKDFYVPLQIEYSYKMNRFISIYGYAEYELKSRQIGAGLGARATLEW